MLGSPYLTEAFGGLGELSSLAEKLVKRLCGVFESPGGTQRAVRSKTNLGILVAGICFEAWSMQNAMFLEWISHVNGHS